MTDAELIEEAYKIVGKFALDDIEKNHAGHVACALETVDGNIYTGIAVDLRCHSGFCAEIAAIAEMLKNRESKIKTIVAYNRHGNIIPPCGHCRETILQVNKENLNTRVIIRKNEVKTLSELMPELWSDVYITKNK